MKIKTQTIKKKTKQSKIKMKKKKKNISRFVVDLKKTKIKVSK